MSTEAVKWAMELAPPMPAQLVATLSALARHADKQGRGAYPSVPRLAALTCKAERSVRRDLRDLEDRKLIRKGDPAKVEHLPADKRPEVYDLALETVVPGGRAAPDDRTRTSARTLASARARGGKRKTSSGQESPAGRPDVDVRGDVGVPSGGTWASAATGRGRPPKEKTEVTTGEEKKTPSSSSGDEHALKSFGAFWLAYPKKKARANARTAWIAAMEQGVDPQHIVDAAVTYAHECAALPPEKQKFIPFPGTWLNGGRYDDEPDQPAGSSPADKDPNDMTEEEARRACQF